jgi:hypothetical protein
MDALKALAEQTGNTVSQVTTSVTGGMNIPWSYVFVGAATAIIAAALVYYVMVYSRTRPLGGDNFEDASANKMKVHKTTEGFYGGAAVGTGQPFCAEASAEAAQLYAMFDGRLQAPGVDSGSDDFREFAQLLGKLACLKKDLMSPSGIVEATRYSDYATTSDLEPVQETAARCLAKTIPQRDLDLTFDKWNKRGTELLLHLCTAANLSEKEVKEAEDIFAKLWHDVYDVAQTQCLNLNAPAAIAGQQQARDPVPHSDDMSDAAPYKGFSVGIF